MALRNTMYYFTLPIDQQPRHSVTQLVFLLWVPQDVGRVVVLSGVSGEVAPSKLIQPVSRIRFLLVAGPTSPFPR